MQIEIGKIYKIKPEFKFICSNFLKLRGFFVQFIDQTWYEILGSKKEKKGRCFDCLKIEHLEPIEKTIYNLERGDEVKCSKNNKIFLVLGVIEGGSKNPLYVLSNNINRNQVNGIVTAKELENYNYEIVQPEPEKSTCCEKTFHQIITRNMAEEMLSEMHGGAHINIVDWVHFGEHTKVTAANCHFVGKDTKKTI